MGEIFHKITERDILHMTPMNYIKYLDNLHSAYSDAIRKSDALTTERDALIVERKKWIYIGAALETERDTLAAKLSNIKDNISLIGQLVCPSGHGAIEDPDFDPLMSEYICKCGDVLHEHTADIAVSKIRAILEVTE